EPVDRPRITLVVSAGPGEGKTTLAANLAAAVVETGQRTVAANTDLRRPRLAGGVAGSAPLDLPVHLEDLATIDPMWLLNMTTVDRLSLLDLSSIDGSAGARARATAAILPRLDDVADAIVVDTSPIGATAEVLELVS